MDLKSSKLWETCRNLLGNLNREIRIFLTPDVEPEKWVFLVGCYNSGTTLLSEILSLHPEISALPTEGHFLTNEFIKDYEIGIPRMWVKREDLFRLTEADEGPNPDRIKKEWCMRLDLKKPVFLEKSPPNTPRTRWLQKHFQPASFVAIVRNGYAVAEGIHRKADPQHHKEGWPINMCAMQWRRSYEILLEDEPFLERLMWVKYEDLARDTEKELDRICDFIGIKHFESLDQGSSFRIHERNESVKDMNRESIDRLSKEQIAIINEIAGDFLEKFGYKLL